MGCVVREVRSPLPGGSLPDFLLPPELPEGAPPPAAQGSPSTPCPVHPVTPTQPPHSLCAAGGLGAAVVPAGRAQSWVQTGLLLLLPRTVCPHTPCGSQGLPSLPVCTLGVSWLLLLGMASGVGPLHTFHPRSPRRLVHTLGQARVSQGLAGGMEHSPEGPGSALGSRQSHRPPACVPSPVARLQCMASDLGDTGFPGLPLG